MVRLPRFGRNKPDTIVQNSTAEDQREGSSSSAGRRRKLVLALGIGAIAYLVVRRRNREGPSLEKRLAESLESDDADGDGLEGAQKIAIGEPASEPDESETGMDGDETSTDEDEPAIETDSEDVSTTERSDAEIDERTETDVQEEPAEPGEMTIDEDVAEEVVDDETGETDEREGEHESRSDIDDVTDTDEE
ncbi:hypothetical protein [Halostagnicola sp. A-GB9-2]|uniref:hypothetical protein n=1 Tax=Halostagnicola sp. A-GB9-2 TaxID=3048066 RepID=UPI0024BF7238|nr:hypothetical protein [Halostagnicola sp. A-GB9-2]MDJ1432611.1 hypothetical protein [Halostagnicola sp. A-GB9-2]